MKKSNQKILIIALALLLVSILTAGTGLVMYGIYTKQNQGSVSRVVAKVFALPAASVEGRKVSYTRYLLTKDAVTKFINSDAGKDVGATMPPELELNKNILEQLIRQKMVEKIASENSISVTDEEIGQIFSEVAAQAASSTDSDINTYLKDNYGWNEQSFKEYVLRPALLEQKVAQAVGSETDPYALENNLITMRQSPEVVVYLKFPETE